MSESATTRFSWLWLIAATLCIVCGAILAVAYLLLKPATLVNTFPPPAEQAPGEVYYVKGSRDPAKGASWVHKRSELLAAKPGVITLTEDELNAWFMSSAHTKSIRRKGGASGLGEKEEILEIGAADFRIGDGMLQVSAPVDVYLPWGKWRLVALIRGNFRKENLETQGGELSNMVMFSPVEIYTGSLPLHRIPGFEAFLRKAIFSNETMPGVAVSAWNKIERADIAGREMRILVSATGRGCE